MTRYKTSRIFLHWLMAVLMLIGYLLGDQLEDLKDAERVNVMQWHVVVGLAILVLAVLRARLRRRGVEPAEWTPAVAWERVLRRAVHLGLYGIFFLLPATGITILATGRGTPLFDLIQFGGWYRWREGHVAAETIHSLLGNVLLVLVGLHLAAVVFHLVIRRDRVLWRMIPTGSAQP